MLRWIRWYSVIGTILWAVMWASVFPPFGTYGDMIILVVLVLPVVVVGLRILIRSGVAVSSTKPLVKYRGLVTTRAIALDQVTHFDILDADVFWASGAGLVVVHTCSGRRYILWALGYASPVSHNLLLEEIERLSVMLWGWSPAVSPRPKRAIPVPPQGPKQGTGEYFLKDIFGSAPWSGKALTR